MAKRDDALTYALLWTGRFYIWGGDDPSGFDCSGFVVEILQSVGVIPHNSDYSADGLYNLFKNYPVDLPETPKPGSLVFWLKNDIAIHVEIMVDKTRSIGASGSGSPQYSLDDTIEKFKSRSSLFAELIIAGDYPAPGGPGDNVLIWLIKRALEIRESIYRNGYIKIRPINAREGSRVILDPFRRYEGG